MWLVLVWVLLIVGVLCWSFALILNLFVGGCLDVGCWMCGRLGCIVYRAAVVCGFVLMLLVGYCVWDWCAIDELC